MINAFNAWLEVPSDSLQVIADVIGMLHTASLLVDDVEDSSLLRRGFPVAHNIFGVPQTINSANYMYFRALEKAQTLKSPDATRIIVYELLQLHRGQGMDLYWRDSLVCPTEREYLDMVGKKTGGLFRLAVKLMQAESPKTVPQGCVPLADKLGLLFQIRDDYQNLNSEEYSDSKAFGMTQPICNSITSSD
ncbi:geranylgeranyl pyrophosphate synthase [Penicillium cinerascens]|uniref:Geranylgeranyl pyrophosphate synthase n=1 Tax=Penicillium cinerascens TaxID=70096 RepID=A0A9W9N8H6_9EURO|nr:geranylgeranyl pyrophosphate synthase [Penicillium cinerascens]KAJ5215203.1 geranylgeranyl pyrophosphate synthase [Penicillium cinerascens]